MEEKKLLKRKEKAIKDNNQEALAQTCNYLGDHYNQLGDFRRAVAEYTTEAAIYKQLNRPLEMAMAHKLLAEVYISLSEFDNALEHSNVYLKTVQTLRNKIEEQRAFFTLGRVHLINWDTASNPDAARKSSKSAEKAFIRSLLIAKELSGQVSKFEQLKMQASLYINISQVKEQMANYEESITYMEKAIKICKANDLYELLHLSYVATSLLYQSKSNTSLSLKFCNLALTIAELLPNKARKIVETLILKAEIMNKVGDLQSAKQILHKAYKMKTPAQNDRANIEKTLKIVASLCRTLDDLVTTSSVDYPARRKLFEKMGDGYCLLSNFPKAIDYYLKALECIEKSGGVDSELIPIYVSLYQTYKDDKQYDKALEFYWKEYELNKDNPVESFTTLCNIGEVCELQMKEFWTTYDVYQKALATAKKANNAKLEKIAFARLVKLTTKSNMSTMMEDLKIEAQARGFDLDKVDDDSDTESNANSEDVTTLAIGDEIHLDELTDSEIEMSDCEEPPKPTRKRVTTGLTLKKNNKGETQLHQACIAGNIQLVRCLLDQGHAVNVRDNAGWLPLHEACNYGYRDIVELLLDRGAATAINDKGGTGCEGITPLIDACSNGLLDVAELLLERGANATLRMDLGETAYDVLEKWRTRVKLDDCEQAQYISVRSKLREQLVKAGFGDKTTPVKNSTMDNSMDKLERLAYGSDSEKSDDEDVIEEEHTGHGVLREYNSPNSGPALRKGGAQNVYKSVMEQIKRPNRKQITDEDVKPVKKRRPAFLAPDEVGDDWLDDDIGPEKKKRRYLKEFPIPKETETISYAVSSVPSTSKENVNDAAFSWDGNDQVDAFQILLDPDVRQKQARKLKLPRSSSLTSSSSSTTSGRKVTQQSSLFDSGFCRFRSESPASIDDFNEVGLEPDSTTLITLPDASPIKVDQSPTLGLTISFKIKVEEELLLVPVDRKKINEVNIRWLAEEASRRYYNLVGLRPVLRLMTSDGFAFEENDLISVALEHNMISTKVLEWKMSSLPDRYVEMANQLGREIVSEIRTELERGQISNSLVLRDMFLLPIATQPIFKAVLHQSSLRILDLANNFIQDEGCKQLAKSLHTLRQLKSLNLQGNCITSDGLESLCSTKLDELEELQLSQNSLGNKSVRYLDQFCNNCVKLQRLFIAQCGLTNLYDFDLRFFELTHFDVSFNRLTADCFKALVSKLNSSRLHQLNLNFAADFSAGPTISDFLQSGTCEKFKHIDLVGLQLTDSDIYTFVQSLSKSTELASLNFSENSKLTETSLEYIMGHLTLLKKVSFNQCPNIRFRDKFEEETLNKTSLDFLKLSLVDCDGYIDSESILRRFWTNRWGGNGQIEVCQNNISLYTDKIDLSRF